MLHRWGMLKSNSVVSSAAVGPGVVAGGNGFETAAMVNALMRADPNSMPRHMFFIAFVSVHHFGWQSLRNLQIN